MTGLGLDGHASADILERRWFAAGKAVSAARAQSDALLKLLETNERAWDRARARLAALEGVRDALGEQLAQLDGQREAQEPSVS